MIKHDVAHHLLATRLLDLYILNNELLPMLALFVNHCYSFKRRS